MRLIHAETLQLEEFHDPSETPPYLILSHTWHDDEVTLQDFEQKPEVARAKKGFLKIAGICRLAKQHDVQYTWIDTCCIDKTNSTELGEALNSMYLWYAEARTCIAYLDDMPPEIADRYSAKDYLPKCRWFTRGWTLQELIAPREVAFYNAAWELVGSKSDELFASAIASATHIDIKALLHQKPLSDYTVAQRMSWAAGRKTKRPEDKAYSLMGIFDINIPPMYGEREKAFQRLQEEIIKKNPDLSILAWFSAKEPYKLASPSPHRLFALSPDEFQPHNCPTRLRRGDASIANMGLKLHETSLICVQVPLKSSAISQELIKYKYMCRRRRNREPPDAIFPAPFRQDLPKRGCFVLYALAVGGFPNGQTCAILLRKTGPGFFAREIHLPLAAIPRTFRHPDYNLRYPWDAPDKLVIHTIANHHDTQHLRRAIQFSLSTEYRCKFSLRGDQAEIQPNRTDWEPNSRILFRPDDADCMHVVPIEVYIGGDAVQLVGLVRWYVPPRIDLVSRELHPEIFDYLVNIPSNQRRRWIDLATCIGSSRLRPMSEHIDVMVGEAAYRISMSLSLDEKGPKIYLADLKLEAADGLIQDTEAAARTDDESLDGHGNLSDNCSVGDWSSDSDMSEMMAATQSYEMRLAKPTSPRKRKRLATSPRDDRDSMEVVTSESDAPDHNRRPPPPLRPSHPPYSPHSRRQASPPPYPPYSRREPSSPPYPHYSRRQPAPPPYPPYSQRQASPPPYPPYSRRQPNSPAYPPYSRRQPPSPAYPPYSQRQPSSPVYHPYSQRQPSSPLYPHYSQRQPSPPVHHSYSQRRPYFPPETNPSPPLVPIAYDDSAEVTAVPGYPISAPLISRRQQSYGAQHRQRLQVLREESEISKQRDRTRYIAEVGSRQRDAQQDRKTGHENSEPDQKPRVTAWSQSARFLPMFPEDRPPSAAGSTKSLP